MQEPRFAARVSKITSFKEGIEMRLKIKRETGTKVKSATSFVTNMEEKNTKKVSKK